MRAKLLASAVAIGDAQAHDYAYVKHAPGSPGAGAPGGATLTRGAYGGAKGGQAGTKDGCVG